MPFETINTDRRSVAVVGGGISGLAAAHLLADRHRVVLYEAATRLGGHARTVLAGKRGDQPVDTGFIVFNKVNYPGLLGLFETLDVPYVESDMSFGASIDGGRLEFGLRSPAALFCQPTNALKPAYLRMLRDVMRFNRHGPAAAGDGSLSIRALLDALGTGPWFRDYYLLPLSGAIWSTPTQDILDFPARALLDFFRNHALLGATGQHQWYTVDGGSVEYVRRLEASLTARGVDLRTGAPVAAIRRGDGPGVMIRARGGAEEHFDEVILATHSDDSLAMLSDADGRERLALSKVRYQPNRAVLHADTSVMPQRRRAWASWNYTEAPGRRPDRIDLTYWMNSLQPIPLDDPMFVTLNGTRPVDEALIYDEVEFRHPVYDAAALEGQAEIRALNGTRNTWFCGAWMRNGFHEDGFASAVDVVRAMADPANQAAA
ncbi:cyclopropane-fatty-acyl-phospholipid synthase [Rhodobacteraceae bacterium CCMM004]|nr:cyclopropane-fatty-acyl-phospholipid synthase [Rhodobacteraceae bacterium CCMM004]